MPIRRPAHGCHGYSSSRNSVLWAFSSLVVQFDQAPRLNRIQATSTRGVHARIRRVAGCATPTGSAGHAGATANLELTFHLDHSAGADQPPPAPGEAFDGYAFKSNRQKECVPNARENHQINPSATVRAARCAGSPVWLPKKLENRYYSRQFGSHLGNVG